MCGLTFLTWLTKELTVFSDLQMNKDVKDILENPQRFILVPVDFSSESIHALRFAHGIASKMGIGLTIAHIHPMPGAWISTSTDFEMMENARKRLEALVHDFCLELEVHGKQVPVESHFDTGNIEQQLFALIAEDRYSMIILSTLGEDTISKKLTGSTSTHIGMLSSKPVIVVPIHAPIRFPENLVVGLSDELFDDASLKYLLEFASSPKSRIEFVYIGNDAGTFTTLKEKVAEKIMGINHFRVPFYFSRVYTDAKNIEDLLVDVVADKMADMVVLATHHRSAEENLRHRSITKRMLIDPVVTVMILHSFYGHVKV